MTDQPPIQPESTPAKEELGFGSHLSSAASGFLIGTVGGLATIAASFFTAAIGGRLFLPLVLLAGAGLTAAAGSKTKAPNTGALSAIFGAVAGPLLLLAGISGVGSVISDQYAEKTPEAISADCKANQSMAADDTLKKQGIAITCAP